MITVHGPDGQVIEKSSISGRARWMNVVAPDDDDLVRVKEHAQFDHCFLDHALDLHECPRIEGDDDATLVVFRAPYIETGHGDQRYSTIPIGIILGEETITTICKVDDPALNAILEKNSAKRHMASAESLISSLIRDVSLLYMTYLKDISTKIQEVEHHLAESRSNDDLKALLILQKSVTYFHSALKTNDFIIDRIIRKGLHVGRKMKLSFSEEEYDLLDYALTETRQGIYMSKIFNEVLNSVSNIYSSIISNSVNQIMKVLTSLTVIIMIPTFITSMYGMNVELPFQQHHDAFLFISACGVLVTIGIIVAMKMRKIL